jgi:hypothetical protein
VLATAGFFGGRVEDLSVAAVTALARMGDELIPQLNAQLPGRHFPVSRGAALIGGSLTIFSWL